VDRDVMVLSDDGTVQVDGVDCKKLKDPLQKRFRGVNLSVSLEGANRLPGSSSAAHPETAQTKAE
jgi:hypothetical protein